MVTACFLPSQISEKRIKKREGSKREGSIVRTGSGPDCEVGRKQTELYACLTID